MNASNYVSNYVVAYPSQLPSIRLQRTGIHHQEQTQQ